jgi:hypothetical protein
MPPQPVMPSARTTIPTIARKRSFWAGAAARASDWGEAARSHLPDAVYGRVERAPGIAIFGVVVTLVALGLVGLGVGAGRVYRAIASPTSSRSTAARQGGGAQTSVPLPVKAQDSPAASTPSAKAVTRDEGAVLLDLADSLLAERHDAEVPALLSRLVARRPEAKDDARLRGILLSTAASSDPRAAAASFELLSGPMGESGAALVYELALKKDVTDAIRRRAERWLGGKDFERLASLPVYAAERLRNAKTCEAKHALLDFASDAGGKYVLDYLRELDQHTSCAPSDLEHCYPCMRSDNRLHAAITKLERQ